MKVYVTKYALTAGILAREGKVADSISLDMFCTEGWRGNETYHKPHWHETADAAIKQAEKMRQAKLKSLEKATARMKAVSFEIPA